MRFKGILLNIGSSYIHIVLSVVLNILYIPLAINYLGPDRYGVLIVIQTLINYLTLANFGIPTAVTNLMSQSDTDETKAEIYIKGFKILLKICLAILVILILLYFSLNYFTNWIKGFSNEVRVSSIVLVLFFVLRIPFQISTSAFTANKKIFLSKIYELSVIIITFLSLLLTIQFKQNLIFLAIVSGILLLVLQIMGFVNALYVVGAKTDGVKNIIDDKQIYKPGLSLFFAGLGALIIWNTDNLVISRFLGFQEVAIYSTSFRLFSFGYTSFGLIYAILIPYYGEYFKSKLWDKLRDMFKINLIIIPFIGACVWLVGWLFSKEIIVLWIGNDKLYGGSSLSFLLGAYGLSLAYAGVMFNLLTSLNQLKFLFYLTLAEATINLVGSLIFVKLFGAAGVAGGTLLASILVPVVVLPFLIDKNKILAFRFPFTQFLSSVIFYFIFLITLFYTKMDELRFIYKLLLSLGVLLAFVVFQYQLNKKNILKIYKDLRPNRNRSL